MRASRAALVAALLISLPSSAADRLFAVRGAPDGAVVVLPRVAATAVDVLTPRPDLFVLVVEGADLETETWHPPATWVSTVRVMGPWCT